MTARKLIVLFALLASVVFGKWGIDLLPPQGKSPVTESAAPGDEVLSRLFSERKSSVQVQGAGVVRKLLPDDNDGNRHQRFVVILATGQTLLVAHNIDQASRIEGLKVGDRVEFRGEYAWNPQGGVIHWTHRDPSGRHPAGWIRHNGRTYQ